MTLLLAVAAVLLVQTGQASSSPSGQQFPVSGEYYAVISDTYGNDGHNLNLELSGPNTTNEWKFVKEGNSFQLSQCKNPKRILLQKQISSSCSASSYWSKKYLCLKAFDGKSNCTDGTKNGWKNGWYSKSGEDPVGQWVQASFDRKIIITSVKIQNTYKPPKEIEISFDGGNKTIVELSDACTTWKEISLVHPVVTNTIRIAVNSVHVEKKFKYIGIKEIAIYGCV